AGLHQGRSEGADVVEVDRYRADELPLEEHRQTQRRPPAVLLGQWIERESAVELNVLGEDWTLLDDDLGDETRCEASQLVFGDARLHAVPHLDGLFGGVAGPGQGDEAGGGARGADRGLGAALRQPG